MKPLPASLSPAQREFAQAVRTLLHDAGGSLRSIESQVHSSRSALHRLASGQVQSPDVGTVLELRRLAERKEPVRTVSEEDLQRLLQRVMDEHMRVVTEPAADIVARAGGGEPAATVDRTGAPSGVPVLAAGGDRRNGAAVDVFWPVDELVLHLNSGRYEHAVGMLDYAGGKAPAVESAAAIQACRGRGLTEAADILLRKVVGRPREIVLAVVSYLIDVGNVADAGVLARVGRSAQDA